MERHLSTSHGRVESVELLRARTPFRISACIAEWTAVRMVGGLIGLPTGQQERTAQAVEVAGARLGLGVRGVGHASVGAEGVPLRARGFDAHAAAPIVPHGEVLSRRLGGTSADESRKRSRACDLRGFTPRGPTSVDRLERLLQSRRLQSTRRPAT